MTNVFYDEILTGQGLAGTTLAWCLRRHGRRVLVIDRETLVTSSRIAAGLMTPVTGRRVVTSWRWSSFWTMAVAFYRRVEAETHNRFFHPSRMVRLFANESERELFSRRSDRDNEGLLSQPAMPIDSHAFADSFGGFEMQEGGRLDVARYLDVSRDHFQRDGQYRADDLSVERDIEVVDDGVVLPRLGIRARRVIFCQGIDAADNPWFRDVQFKPAKGEILTLRIAGLTEERIVHRGVWLMPLGDGLFRAGATYEWNELNCEPTQAGRDEICTRLREFLKRPFEVIGHDAAVRPILRQQYPVVGLHPQHPQLGFFNGLGSKGALQAPWLAEHFAGFLAGEHPLDPEIDLNSSVSPRR